MGTARPNAPCGPKIEKKKAPVTTKGRPASERYLARRSGCGRIPRAKGRVQWASGGDSTMKRMGLTSSCSQSSFNKVESDDQKTRERAIPLVGYRDIVGLEIRQGQNKMVLFGGEGVLESASRWIATRPKTQSPGFARESSPQLLNRMGALEMGRSDDSWKGTITRQRHRAFPS